MGYAMMLVWAVAVLGGASGLVIQKEGTVIDGLRITAKGNCIEVKASRVVIKNSIIGPCGGVGILVTTGVADVEISGNAIEDVKSGVYAIKAERVNVHHNRFLNMRGPFPRGQYVQFNSVRGGGNRIMHNEGECRRGESYPEDLVSLYKSTGLPSDPILVVGNRFRGGGPSKSGGGIMTGDNDGSYVVVRENTLVDPGQYGIAIAGGEGVVIENNRVYARQQSFTNVGIYVWRQKNTAKCKDHRVAHNKVRWYSKSGGLNSFWDGKNCGAISGLSTNNWRADLDDTIYAGLGVRSLLDGTAPNPSPPSAPTPSPPRPTPSPPPRPSPSPPPPSPSPVRSECRAVGNTEAAARVAFRSICGGEPEKCDGVSGSWVCKALPTLCLATAATRGAAEKAFAAKCHTTPSRCVESGAGWGCVNRLTLVARGILPTTSWYTEGARTLSNAFLKVEAARREATLIFPSIPFVRPFGALLYMCVKGDQGHGTLEVRQGAAVLASVTGTFTLGDCTAFPISADLEITKPLTVVQAVKGSDVWFERSGPRGPVLVVLEEG